MRTREKILSAALDIAVEFGLESVSLSRVLKKAGLGYGTVYNRFSSKRALFNAMFREAADFRDREVMATYSFTGTLRERFGGYLRGNARFALEHPKEFTFLERYGASPGIAREIRERITFSQSIARSLFDEGRACGAIDGPDSVSGFCFATGALAAVLQGNIAGKFPLSEEDVERTIEGCWRAVKRTPS
jgi:TetR/AcrR family transcriptional regulator, repressor of fatR-cypB operon